LRDGGAERDPALEQALSVLEAADDWGESDAALRTREQRVRRALDAPRPSTAPRRRATAVAFVSLLSVVLLGASAFAAVRYLAERGAGSPVKTPEAHTHAPPRRTKATAPDQAPKVQAQPAPSEAQPAATSAPSRRATAIEARRKQERAARRDAALVHEAVRALRHDGEPARAARLLSRYRRHAPHGPLAEEALSLQVEAERARSNHAAASRLAREYLSRYPHGRYERAVRGTPAAP